MAAWKVLFAAPLLLLLLAASLPTAQGVVCFRCINRGQHDQRCLTSPRDLSDVLIDCGPAKPCTTLKRESVSRGMVVEFFRGCDPPYTNHTEVRGDIRTTHTACHRDECNAAPAPAAPLAALALALSTALALALARL